LLFLANFPFNSYSLNLYSLKSFHSLIFGAKNENKVLLEKRVKGEGLRGDFVHFLFHFLFHSISQSLYFTGLEHDSLFLILQKS